MCPLYIVGPPALPYSKPINVGRQCLKKGYLGRGLPEMFSVASYCAVAETTILRG